MSPIERAGHNTMTTNLLHAVDRVRHKLESMQLLCLVLGVVSSRAIERQLDSVYLADTTTDNL